MNRFFFSRSFAFQAMFKFFFSSGIGEMSRQTFDVEIELVKGLVGQSMENGGPV